MTDRELLEFAAKACELGEIEFEGEFCLTHKGLWNPLAFSADCAAMCAKLMVGTEWFAESSRVICFSRGHLRSSSFADHNNDREAAWRHAATMVAAKIGGMK